jgi:hypothetical protein
MSKNPVQFQKGMSLEAFLSEYGTEVQCRAALIRLRWPDGFVCPKCGGCDYSLVKPRGLFQCSACRQQTSIKSGTIFHGSKTTLRKWFLAIYLMTQSKNDIAALELKRQLGVKYDTAWLIKQKLMTVMLKRNAEKKLSGCVQIDDAYIGGEKRVSEGGRKGRGSPNKIPFVAAVSTREGKPRQIQLRRVSGFTKEEIERYAEAGLAPGAEVVTDGLGYFLGIAEAGFTHRIIKTGGGARRPTEPEFKWVNTALGNIKSAITGTCRSLDFQHSARYLAAYEYRFNRRFDLPSMVPRLAYIALRTDPTPYRTIVPAERRG